MGKPSLRKETHEQQGETILMTLRQIMEKNMMHTQYYEPNRGSQHINTLKHANLAQ